MIEAEDTILNRTIAIKELHAPDEATRKRFVREVMITARLQHPSRRDGTIEVKIRLVSEPDVATIVETAELAHLTGAAELGECLRETLLSVELPPMAEAGKSDRAGSR